MFILLVVVFVGGVCVLCCVVAWCGVVVVVVCVCARARACGVCACARVT